MTRPLRLAAALIAGLLGGTALLLAPTRAAQVEPLPEELRRLPSELGYGYRAFHRQCVKCHTMDRVNEQDDLTLRQWRDLIGKMASKDDAQIPPRDQRYILMYVEHRRNARLDAEGKQQYLTFLDRCDGCHGIGLVYERRVPRAEWPETVSRMARKGGVKITPTDEASILAYTLRMAEDLFGLE